MVPTFLFFCKLLVDVFDIKSLVTLFWPFAQTKFTLIPPLLFNSSFLQLI